MLGCGRKTSADHAPHHQRRLSLAAKHIAELCCLVVQRIMANTEKIHKHQLRHRPQTRCCGAGSHADDRRLRNGGVDHPVGAELRPQPFSDSEHTAKSLYPCFFWRISAVTATQVFTNQNDAFVVLHFLGQGFLDRFSIGFYRHCYHPQYET